MKSEIDKKQIAVLKNTQPFKYLDETRIKIIQELGEFVAFDDAEIILKQGEISPGLYILLSGKADVTVIALGQGRVTLAQVAPGYFFGEVSLLENGPCTASIISCKKTICFLLKRACYNAFLAVMPQLGYFINQAIVEDVMERHRMMYKEIKKLMELPQATVFNKILPSGKKKYHRPDSDHQLFERFSYLHRLPVFQLFSKQELHDFLQHARVVEVRKHCTLIRDGLTRTCGYFIINGSIQISVESRNNRAKVTVYGPNTLVCPGSFIESKPEIFHYTTIGAATLLEISPDYLERLAKTNPLLWYRCHDVFCRYVVSLQSKLNSLTLRLMNEKVISGVKE
ncbi:cyclic nucleotide-binding domain-containing protein [Legionella spiritensis]|uniref:cNMP binding domain-containing protein n=1 Tax=Legionella spiritensis TaxID=452 RepID=A0A0W0YXR6_LEGSP|nr:cyclic nucleotide-binding domain-containing protein [Legionella spiritensis]KTD61701.1 cNMP binding domain-containing protein [Legionella spiritensis]SNV38868.1 cNMP binding domain-containing protein [Legionella spiritensis]